jgi:hypothetical protein
LVSFSNQNHISINTNVHLRRYLIKHSERVFESVWMSQNNKEGEREREREREEMMRRETQKNQKSI